MTRNILDDAHIHPAIRKTIANHHADAVSEVQAAVASNDVVVVGMKQNPFPKKARKALDTHDTAGIAYKHLTYGTYLGGWRRRGAFRMRSGWGATGSSPDDFSVTPGTRGPTLRKRK